MGWIFQHEPKGRKTVDIMAEAYGERWEILAHAQVKGYGYESTFYAALRNTETGEVMGVADLIQRVPGHFNFGYKGVSENMGPCDAECPTNILDLLSPEPDNEYAVNWRKKCREYNARKDRVDSMQPGDQITLSMPLIASNGLSTATFERGQNKNEWIGITSSGLRFRCNPGNLARYKEQELVLT